MYFLKKKIFSIDFKQLKLVKVISTITTKNNKKNNRNIICQSETNKERFRIEEALKPRKKLDHEIY